MVVVQVLMNVVTVMDLVILMNVEYVMMILQMTVSKIVLASGVDLQNLMNVVFVMVLV